MREAPLMEHLEELRNRLIWSIVAWAVMTAVAFTFRVQILAALKRPLDAYNASASVKAELIVLNITEPFLTAFKVAAFGGLALALPFIVYQVWAFIAPGLYDHERRLAVPFILGAGFSFALGAVFAYFVLLPFAVPFLLGFLGDVVTPQISIGMYMGQVVTFLALMGILFEMPVVSYLLAKLGLLTSRFLINNWRIAVVLLVTLAAIITPTVDVVNLSLVSIPLMVLYGVSILLVKWAERKQPKEAEASPA
ncbi:MAG: twin-arginine translocase subunit TatC [Meiothermus sp.]|uniref:twin-arginine translocase subunit TatC n=1 Tax=Meiothermus sp. TaxID=1955249 RepID=UPI0025E177C4|nr:twin-arginine translocase subunit TatC [Meiothermus sp.]MCS7059024.1 twin-arginine translocase subunit TatC [Meiothermus sp.]MCS7194173.1 twin-arginine translocase subunit TatC [Meiothermus sp.]MCX7740637.1 twin-arginine translocase subunit TatC [Meiothermus sp.]MDW8090034.1 twin-arginine translocase subunit TatC [Meiothermus sp.]MDW8480682.1 twin-arginine translocase subunit TatC [Meiothermus sp.]